MSDNEQHINSKWEAHSKKWANIGGIGSVICGYLSSLAARKYLYNDKIPFDNEVLFFFGGSILFLIILYFVYKLTRK